MTIPPFGGATPPRARAAIYVRVSTAGQEDGTSLETQEAACRAHAVQQGYEVAAVYREIHTGTDLWERPQLTALREAVRRHEVAAVIAHAIDRLSRDPVHLGVLLSEADHAGVTVTFVTEPLDDSPEGQLIRFVRGYAAKVEHMKIVERVNRGRRGRAQQGRLIPSTRPLYGYAWVDGKPETVDGKVIVRRKIAYTENPLTAPVVRRLFREAAGGTPLRALATQLTAEGVPTPNGAVAWRRSTIWTILTNPSYAGNAVAYRWTARGRNDAGQKVTTRVLRPEAERIPLPAGTVPPLVDDDTFTAVQHRLARNKQEATRNNRHPEAALLRGGYAICGYCGSTLRVETVTRGLRYVCGRAKERTGACTLHAMLVEDLDARVWAKVSAVLRDPEIIERKLAEQRAHDPTIEDIAALDRRRGELARKRGNLVDRIADADPDTAGVMMERAAALSSELARLDTEREALLARRAAWEASVSKAQDLIAWCRTVAQRLQGASYHTKRLALDYLGVRVKLFREGEPDRYLVEAIEVTPEGDVVYTPLGRTGSLTTKPTRAATPSARAGS